MHLYGAYILQAVKSARAATSLSFSLSLSISFNRDCCYCCCCCCCMQRTAEDFATARRRAALIECRRWRRCVCCCTSERAASHYGRLLEMSRMQPRVLAREDDGEIEEKRPKERKKRTETMTAARHNRIVILSRIAHVYASTVRSEKWPYLNVSGTSRRGKRGDVTFTAIGVARCAFKVATAECRSMISRFMFRNTRQVSSRSSVICKG